MTNHRNPDGGDGASATPHTSGDIAFEKYKEMLLVSHRTLDAANLFTDMPSLLEAFLQIVKTFMGCSAVSVRILDADGHVTHMEHSGFAPGDCALDTNLSAGAARCPRADVILGTTDAGLSCITDSGSLFTNRLNRAGMQETPEADAHPCGGCSRNRYASSALIPLRSWNSTLGLIHLADLREDMAPLEKIVALESAAMQLSIAIQRKQAVSELKESQRNLKSVFDAIPDMILICDRQLKIIMSNREELGRNPSKDPHAVDQCCKILGSGNGVCDGCIIQSVFETAQPAIEEVVNAWDHSVREIRAFPVFNDEGNVQHVVGNIRDITQIKRGELMLKDAKQEAEFYLDLMTHDLTNFSQVLLGNLLLFERFEDPGETGRKYLATCRRQVAKIESLLSKVRAFSQVKQVDENMLQKTDIDAMIHDSVKSLRTLYPKKRIEISFEQCAQHMGLGTDLLEHVIMNILENAVKYADKDPVHIGIVIDNALRGRDDFWEIRISDNGPGVPDGMKSKIFERYSRATQEKRGTGLGLSLSKAIIEKFGGSIRVQDRVAGHPEQGSTFIVTLPRGNGMR